MIVKILNIFENTVSSCRPTRTAESVRGDDDDVGGGVYVAAAMHWPLGEFTMEFAI